jgi:hypothetical protein
MPIVLTLLRAFVDFFPRESKISKVEKNIIWLKNNKKRLEFSKKMVLKHSIFGWPSPEGGSRGEARALYSRRP